MNGELHASPISNRRQEIRMLTTSRRYAKMFTGLVLTLSLHAAIAAENDAPPASEFASWDLRRVYGSGKFRCGQM